MTKFFCVNEPRSDKWFCCAVVMMMCENILLSGRRLWWRIQWIKFFESHIYPRTTFRVGTRYYGACGVRIVQDAAVFFFECAASSE